MKRLDSDWGRRVVAGAVFGLYMAHLLYFLNPQTRISTARLTGVSLVYALIAGLIFGTLLWGLQRLRGKFREEENPASGSGVGFLAAAAFLSAVVYWGHVALLRVYLPRGAVQTLWKASTVVAAAALVLFLVWLLDRTMVRRELSGRLFLASCLLILVSWFFLSERRARYRVEPTPTAVAVRQSGPARPIIVVAIRDLPFDWIVQLGGEELVPFFRGEQQQTFLTRLEPFPTTSPKTLWASLATGKLPHGHGVTGRFSYQTALTAPGERLLLVPYWVGFKAWGLVPPVRRISAQLPAGDALAFWLIFQRLGHRAAVINWPSTAGTQASSVQALRPSLTLVSPRARGIYQSFSPQIRSRLIAALTADQRAARLLLKRLREDDRPSLSVLSLNGLSEVIRELELEGNRLPARSTLVGEVVRSHVEHLDGLLTEIEQAASEDATLMVVSPSGPKPPQLPATPLELAAQLVSQQEPGSADGCLLLRGRNVIVRDHPRAASVTDVVPSVLFVAGLPLARDMDGRPVAEAFREEFVEQNPMSLIPTYQAAQLQRPSAP